MRRRWTWDLLGMMGISLGIDADEWRAQITSRALEHKKAPHSEGTRRGEAEGNAMKSIRKP